MSGPDGASVEVPLQIDEGKNPDFWLQTPEDLKGFELRLLVEHATGEANLRVSIEYAGLPVRQALGYVKFLRALYSEKGKFILTMLEPKREKFDVTDLPLFVDEATRSNLEVTLRFLGDLIAVSEATGVEFVYPDKLDEGDVRAARRGAEVVRAGWITERVKDLRLTPTAEGARNLPLEEADAPLTVSVESEHTSIRLLGQEVRLGPSRHWVESARMVTPPERVRVWLESDPDPEDHLELLFVPVEGAPLHTFFPEWPKPSRERVRRRLRAFEEKYGMRSDKFAAAWRKGRSSVRHVQDGNIWMSFISARKELERG